MNVETDIRNAVDRTAAELTLAGIELSATLLDEITLTGVRAAANAFLAALADLAGAEHELAYYGGTP